MTNTTDVPERVRQLAAKVVQVHPMRRGSLSERRMKCGKKGCACVLDTQGRHGPYFSLTRVIEGRTQSRYLTAEQASLVQRQLEAGKQFRADVEACWQACEHWADAELEAASAAASPQEAEKGGSRRILRMKSRKKSKR